MTATSSPRRRISAGSSDSHPSYTPPNQGDEDNPIRLRLKLSPPSKKNEGVTKENDQTDPPNQASVLPPRQSNLALSTSINMCASIIRPLKRSREQVVSESDISVLDLGPSLTQLDIHPSAGGPILTETRIALLNAAVRVRESHIGIQSRPLEPYPHAPRPRPNEGNAYHAIQRARAEESESEPVSSASNASPADEGPPALTLRRPQPELHLNLHSMTGLRAPPRRRVSRVCSPVAGDIHCLGYGWGFGGYERVQERSDFYIVESDSDGDIRSTTSSVHGLVDTSQSSQAAARRVSHAVGTWDRRSSDLFTTGLSEHEQSLELFSGVEVDDMAN